MLRKSKFMLADSFEVTGEWWLPESPEDKFPGILRYSHTSIELDINGSFDVGDPTEFGIIGSISKKYSRIHGVSNELQHFTLLRAHISGQVYGKESTTKYSAHIILTGDHLPDQNELKLTSLSFYCDYLDAFIGRGVFQIQNEVEKEEFKSVTIKYFQPDKLSWRIDEIEATLDFQTAVDLQPGTLTQGLAARSFVTITSDAPKDIDWFQRQMWRFCYLITLVTDKVTSPSGVRINSDEVDYHGWLLYRSTKDLSAAVNDNETMLLFHLEHLVTEFESILKKWFGVDETMLDAIHLTMNAHRNSDPGLHGRFLLLAHAVEVISRATDKSEYMQVDEYKKVVEILNDAIPSHLSSAHKDSLKSRIQYGNEFSFRLRIQKLLDSLSNDARGIVCNDPQRFKKGIVDTRNYYTHFTDELRPTALTGAAEFWATEKLLLLVRILLFKHIGIDEELIVERIRNHHPLWQVIYGSKDHPECRDK